MVEKTDEEKTWVKIPKKTGIWKSNKPGDLLEGKYVKREPKPFRGKPNYKYTFESDHPDAVDGLISFYGTVGLNNELSNIPIGYDVRIEFMGEKPPKDPKNKPFKIFDLYVKLAKNDPLYKKLYPEDGEEEADENDSEAMNMIEHYITKIKQKKGKKHKPTAWEVVHQAKDDKLPTDDMARLQAQLVKMFKRGEIEEGEKED